MSIQQLLPFQLMLELQLKLKTNKKTERTKPRKTSNPQSKANKGLSLVHRCMLSSHCAWISPWGWPVAESTAWQMGPSAQTAWGTQQILQGASPEQRAAGHEEQDGPLGNFLPWSELQRRAGCSHSGEKVVPWPSPWLGVKRAELLLTFCSSVLSNASTFSCSLRRLAWYAACSCWALPLTCAISALALEKHRFLSRQVVYRRGRKLPKDGLQVKRVLEGRAAFSGSLKAAWDLFLETSDDSKNLAQQRL